MELRSPPGRWRQRRARRRRWRRWRRRCSTRRSSGDVLGFPLLFPLRVVVVRNLVAVATVLMAEMKCVLVWGSPPWGWRQDGGKAGCCGWWRDWVRPRPGRRSWVDRERSGSGRGDDRGDGATTVDREVAGLG
ncbi:putative proline-rich receptor-like protein kinase PERK3 [Iris pallida]|uniref:Proline-rich receptor-like protein kinase PERK3 n=1 Tax=Iris pallida TaxID=29817 RepID=A0AAX6HYV9_IRIPA|nr:putative proline-rich receptor-like protein kinase PERK3 [Iris pallida]